MSLLFSISNISFNKKLVTWMMGVGLGVMSCLSYADEVFRFEAESLSSSGGAVLDPTASSSQRVKNHSQASGGQWLRLDSSAPNAFIWYLGVDVPESGLYKIDVGYRQGSYRGIGNFSVANTEFQATVDQLGPVEYTTVSLGTGELEAGEIFIGTTIVGTNSPYHRLSVDYIELTLMDEPIAFSVIHGDHFIIDGDNTNKGSTVFRDEQSYVEALAQYSSDTPVEVDFSTHRVLLIDMGFRPSGGYTVDAVSIDDQDEAVKVNVNYTAPSCGAAGVITNPYQFVLIPTTKEVLLNENWIHEPCL